MRASWTRSAASIAGRTSWGRPAHPHAASQQGRAMGKAPTGRRRARERTSGRRTSPGMQTSTTTGSSPTCCRSPPPQCCPPCAARCTAAAAAPPSGRTRRRPRRPRTPASGQSAPPRCRPAEWRSCSAAASTPRCSPRSRTSRFRRTAPSTSSTSALTTASRPIGLRRWTRWRSFPPWLPPGGGGCSWWTARWRRWTPAGSVCWTCCTPPAP
mmetsp:Transcript_43594/g.110359  ORF Transcript_43594/g.110359 Transcript_43594/m.110359 type:complete len:212 (-) Transcript_43594:760-1395(-)